VSSTTRPSRSTRVRIGWNPPKRLLRQALEAGCRFTIDTDAHAPGQLDWLDNGCTRAALCGVPADRIVNTWSADDVVAWARGHD